MFHTFIIGEHDVCTSITVPSRDSGIVHWSFYSQTLASSEQEKNTHLAEQVGGNLEGI